MTLISQDDYLTAEAWAAYGSLKDKKISSGFIQPMGK